MNSTPNLNDAQWKQYSREGFLKLGRTLSDTALENLQRRINAIMMGEADLDYDKMLMQLDSSSGEYSSLSVQTNGFKGATLDYRKIQGLEYEPLFLGYLQCPLFHDICRRAYGSENISCSRAMFMNKPARKGTVLPWHQDGGAGWQMDRHPVVTIWTALDAATIENGCVQVIPGSHLLGLLSEGGHTITPEQEAEYCTPEKIVHLELAAGEAVLLHNWLLHASDINHTDTPRRAFSCCYMDARTRKTDDRRPAGNTVFGEGALQVEATGARVLTG
jgi:hypothetical protein